MGLELRMDTGSSTDELEYSWYFEILMNIICSAG